MSHEPLLEVCRAFVALRSTYKGVLPTYGYFYSCGNAVVGVEAQTT